MLDQIKRIIDTVEFDNNKILIDIDNKLPNDTTLKDAVTLITCAIKDEGKIILIYSHKKHCMMNKYLFWLVKLICITNHFNNIRWKNYDKKNTDLRKKSHWKI